MIRDELQKLVAQALKKKAAAGWPRVEIELQHPQEKNFGDFSTNLAMRLSKRLKKAPLEIGKQVVSELNKLPAGKKILEKIEVVSPGFINFTISQDRLYQELKKIHTQREKYGSLNIGRNKKMIVEHTSVNPNKAMHIGHLRNMAIGDSLVQLMKAAGYRVESQNYIDDTGVQVADIIVALNYFKEKPKAKQKFDHFCWDINTRIQKEYEKNPKLLEERAQVLQALEQGDNKISKQAEEVVAKILGDHLTTAGNLGVFYDVYIFESSILRSSLWQKTFEELKKSGQVVYEEAGPNKGCWVFKGLALSQEEELKNPDKILVTSKGLAVYTAKDIAYTLWKFGKSKGDFKYQKIARQANGQDLWASSDQGTAKNFGRAEKVINVVDVRQTYPQLVVKQAIEQLGYKKEAENFRHLAYEVVSLSVGTAKALGLKVEKGKASYAMSGRKGIGVKADDLFDIVLKKVMQKRKESKTAGSPAGKGAVDPAKIAAAAIKAYLLKQGHNQEIAFDLDQAVSLTGDSGPYLQYTHARIHGILKKTKEKWDPKKVDQLREKEELDLIRQISIYPEVVENAVTQLTPHYIYHYLLGLAQAFNTFYDKLPVLKADGDLRAARLELAAVTAQIIKNGLGLLGIDAPARM